MATNDELLTPEEIEALMQAARTGPSTGGSAPPAQGGSPAAGSAEGREPAGKASGFRPSETASAGWSGHDPASLLQEAESQLSAALAHDLGHSKGPPPELGDPQHFEFPDFSPAPAESTHTQLPIAALQDVELELRVELGRTELMIEEVLQLREGTVVPLDKLAGDPVDILVNGRLVARGEVLVLNDNFCVRVAEIVTPDV